MPEEKFMRLGIAQYEWEVNFENLNKVLQAWLNKIIAGYHQFHAVKAPGAGDAFQG